MWSLTTRPSVFVTILRQDLPSDRAGFARLRIDLDENAGQEQAVARRLEALRPRRQEPLEGLLAGDADDGVAAAGHAGVGDVGRAAGQDPLVRRRDVGVRADDGRDPAVEVPAEGLLLGGRLGVEIDDDDGRHGPEGGDLLVGPRNGQSRGSMKTRPWRLRTADLDPVGRLEDVGERGPGCPAGSWPAAGAGARARDRAGPLSCPRCGCPRSGRRRA